jgi:hypothetical protein
MAIATHGSASNYLQRAPSPSGLADVLDVILDKGLVIDVFVRVSVIGIEILTIDARVVIASVDTYLRFAEAVNRLDLTETAEPGIDALRGAAESVEDSRGKERAGRALEGAKDKASSAVERVRKKATKG